MDADKNREERSRFKETIAALREHSAGLYSEYASESGFFEQSISFSDASSDEDISAQFASFRNFTERVSPPARGEAPASPRATPELPNVDETPVPAFLPDFRELPRPLMQRLRQRMQAVLPAPLFETYVALRPLPPRCVQPEPRSGGPTVYTAQTASVRAHAARPAVVSRAAPAIAPTLGNERYTAYTETYRRRVAKPPEDDDARNAQRSARDPHIPKETHALRDHSRAVLLRDVPVPSAPLTRSNKELREMDLKRRFFAKQLNAYSQWLCENLSSLSDAPAAPETP